MIGAFASASACAVPGCTFGRLADYEIRQCNPRPVDQGSDDCNVLNEADAGECSPWQCNGVHRCVQAPRDDDKDGDPSVTCGGRDCDDKNPNISSLRVGLPTQLASLPSSVEEAKYALPTDGGDGSLLVFASAYSSGECLSVAKADVASTVPLGACALLTSKLSLLPTQPNARRVGDGGYSSAFVSLSGCAAGALGFAYADQQTLTPCGAGAAKPAIAMIDPNRALLAWYEAPATSRASALDDCPRVSAAPLRIALVGSVAAPNLVQATVPLSSATKSMQPPALITRNGVTFVASPADDAATMWALDGPTMSQLAVLAVPSLAGARSTSLAPLLRDDGTVRFGIASELGCESQTIHLALVDYDPATKHFSFVSDSIVAAASGGFQWHPTVAWVPARKRWLVSWLQAGSHAVARFVGENGEPGAPEFQLVVGSALAASALSSGHVALVANAVTGEQILDSPARCP